MHISGRAALVRFMAALSLTAGAVATITCTSLPTTAPATEPATRAAGGAGGRGFGRGGAPGGGFAGGGFGRRGGFGRGSATIQPELPFYDATLSLEERLDDLMQRLTLPEKVAQMQMDAPAIERLGIPAYHWWNEALHGVARNGEATVFPQAIGMAASWNTDLHYRMAQVIGVEGRAKYTRAMGLGIHAQYAGLDFWSPNINIFRDPRWGRGQETYGEDPYLTGRMGVAFVKGLQGDDPFYFATIATPKHYAVHSGPEPERHRFDVHPSAVDLWTTYLPAFEATVREGHAYSVMAAYNRVDGLPCSANPRLLTDILRKQWGFDGYVVSDVDAVRDVFFNHQTAETAEEAAAMSVKAGCDLNGGTTYQALAGAVQLGLLTEADIDKSLRRLMTARFRLGQFDPTPTVDSPSRNPYAAIPGSAYDTREHDALALQMARQSMVMLKNERNTLPLRKDVRSIAVIGPNADGTAVLYGNYNGTASHPITILQGIRNTVASNTRVLYEQGGPLTTEQLPLDAPVPASCLFTDAARTVHGLYGTYYRSFLSGDRPTRTRIDAVVDLAYPDQMARDGTSYTEGMYVKWTGVFVPPDSGPYQLGCSARDAYRLYLDDRLVVDEWYGGTRRSVGTRIALQKDRAYAITIEYYHPPAAGGGGRGGFGGFGGASGGSTTAPATVPAQLVPSDTASIQFRWTRPSPEEGGNGPDPFYAGAVRAAQSADAVVLVLGLTANLEREEAAMHNAGFLGGDRTTLDLPEAQEILLEKVTAAAGSKPVVLVLAAGSALSVNWANEHVPAIMQAWYPGQHGDAVADVLFGNCNPAGRLPVTFYKSVNDLPAFTDYAMTGRTYRYFDKPVLYPFGYGLSYTKFEYTELKVATLNPSTSDGVVVSVGVKNTGALAGDEVVQCYVNRPQASEVFGSGVVADAPPHKTLVGFLRISLQPGEHKTVQFTITPHQLATVSGDGKRIVNPGPLVLQVGPNSASGLSQAVTLTGQSTPPEYRFVAPRVVEAAATQP